MPKTLLLADDSVTIQKVVGLSFASEDIEITTVDNGNAALAKARELRPDVILADVVMPGLNGYEVCEAIRADPELRHVPVVLLTGTFEAFDEERAARAGAAGHVSKPFEAQTLVDRVRALLAAPPPVPPALRTAAPTASVQPSPSAGDDAFDFFADADSELSLRGSAASDAGAEPLEFDESDAAFAFGDDDLSASLQDPKPSTPLQPPDTTPATVAILPERRADARVSGDDAFDLVFEAGSRAAEEPVGEADLAYATLLDPAVGSGFDVSSSDLELERPQAPAEASLLRSAPHDPLAAPLDTSDSENFDDFEASLPPDPVLDLLRPEPLDESSLTDSEPLAASDPFSPTPSPTPRPFGVELDPDQTASRAASPTPASPSWSPPAWPQYETPESDAEPFDARPRASDPADDPRAPRAGAPLTPALREDLHETLEKIAWDAFGQVTEKVVQQAIERIEQVAWEVVPKLAEVLIQEEIRRLKGENPTD